MLAAYVTGLSLVEVGFLYVVWLYKKTTDPFVVPLILVALALRLCVGVYNFTSGPLPGANVDAVHYEQLAASVASTFNSSGVFSIPVGRNAYSSILAIPYIAGGHHQVFPVLVNLLFVAFFLGLVYRSVALVTGSTRARLAMGIAALYPTSIFYTSVPLREPVLMWAIALWLYGLLLYVNGRASAFGWRTIAGAVVAIWLNVGFAAMAVLIPVVWAVRRAPRHSFRVPVARPIRLVVAFGVLIALAGAFLTVGGNIPKVPNNPSQVLSVSYWNSLRGAKASATHGRTGYGGSAPTSAGLFILSIPVVDAEFLTAPLPHVPSGGAQLLAAVEGLGLLALCLGAIVIVVRTPRGPARGSALLVAAVLAVLITTFAIGTANAGIAVRHRSDFAWMFGVLIGIALPYARDDGPIPDSTDLVARHGSVQSPPIAAGPERRR
jgi:hypothetical protein